MARTQTRGSGFFSGLVLISVGALLLLHNYGHLEMGSFFAHWWPLLIIFWGAVKLYERTAGRRFGGGPGGAITAGEVFLVLAMLALMGMIVAVDYTKTKIGIEDWPSGDSYTYDIESSSKAIPAKARILVRNGRGDISVRASDDEQIHLVAKKSVRTWSQGEADRLAKKVSAEIAQNGDAFEVRPAGYDLSDARLSVDLDVSIPKNSPLTVKTEKGDVTISELSTDVTVTNQKGDVDLRNITGDISVEMRDGDVKASDISGNVKVSGKGGEVEVNEASGSVTIDGDFYGPVRADRITKGVRLISAKTDMTLSALSGHMEAGTGNLDVIDAPGNLSLRTRDLEINVENPGGKVNIDNRNAEISVRYTSAPKEDVQITNSSAGISLTLPGASSFEVQADCRNCEISSEFPGLGVTKSESGDSHVAGKYGSGRGPKIILKTSYGNIALRRTSVNMPRPANPTTPPSPPTPQTPIPPPTEQ
jgi:DUF4097 and DUF4098 domain-containing protein YvlB